MQNYKIRQSLIELKSKNFASVKITPTLVAKKISAIEESIRSRYPEEWRKSWEIKYPKNIYSKMGYDVTEFSFEYDFYDRVGTIYVNENSGLDVDYYSDVSYWESVHDGEINPNEESEMYEEYPEYDSLYDIEPKEKDSSQLLTEILSSDIPDMLKQDAVFSVVGKGNIALDELSNQYIKSMIHEYFDNQAARLGLTKGNSLYKVWLEDTNKKRFFSFHMGAFPSDVYNEKNVEFYNEVTDQKILMMLDLLSISGYRIDKETKKILQGKEIYSKTQWHDIGYVDIHQDFFTVYYSENQLKIGLCGGSGVQNK
ncbi:hypothetical protein [Sporosarcina highlanderae]|uniref:Uncharacterized protein n=1 Tax=Sporosarcina highlanderae TaxID=3035916 RepID=A0ABT8JL41_9BACL|nr:hypothetical protein [Sporosarcina highlanderae]MDN4605868.1 hypothetical protein [Sporosarcina highlanderae]